MAQYNIKQLLDKTFFAQKKVPYYRSTSGKVTGYFAPGATIGVLYSYVQKGSTLWFMFNDKNGKPFYVKNNPGANEIDITALVKQGTKSTDQEAKESEGESLWNKSKLEYFVKKYGLWLLGGALATAYLFRQKSN